MRPTIAITFARIAKPTNPSVAARTLLRELLGVALDRDPHGIELIEPVDGKPYLPGADLDFNLSHGGDWIAIAIARGCRVGIDVEPIVDRDASAIADAFEIELDPDVSFARQWVRIEARHKVVGAGLSIPIDPDAGRDCAVVDLELDPAHAAAYAWAPDQVGRTVAPEVSTEIWRVASS